jgi:hypothetical protein
MPVGSRRAPLDSLWGKKGVHNAPSIINGRKYSDHALDRMMQRGVQPSIVEEAISKGVIKPANVVGRVKYYDPRNNISVVTEGDLVVTVRFGE